MSKTANVRQGRRRAAGVALLMAAALLLLLAYQSLSTEQYRLYSRNYSYYVTEAAECRALQESDLGAHYAFLADEWEKTAKIAGSYLNQHRAGAASLGVVSALAIALGVRMIGPGLLWKEKKKEQ